MKKLIFMLSLITILMPIYSFELSEPDPEDTKRITAIIQYTSELRFGDDLKKGDEVVYEVNDEAISEEYSNHILRVIDRNDSTTTILELFEGNELYVEFKNSNKKVIKIWGKDIAGGDHSLTLLSENKLNNIITEISTNTPENIRLKKWKISEIRDEMDINNQIINCKKIDLDIDNLDLPKSVKNELRGKKSETYITLSDDVPKMLPLVPVAFISISKRELLTNENAGFVENNNLKLKSFIKN